MEPSGAAFGRLHPQNATQIFVEFLGTLTLDATSKEAMIVCDGRGTKYQLILIPPTKRTSFPFELSSDGADLSQLSVHGEPPIGVTLAINDQRTILLDIELSVSRGGRERGYQKEGGYKRVTIEIISQHSCLRHNTHAYACG